jgi:hypothetical protein
VEALFGWFTSVLLLLLLWGDALFLGVVVVFFFGSGTVNVVVVNAGWLLSSSLG